jgi:DNA replication protein DnaC
VLDDVGAERPTEWTQEQLNKLIDYRACNELPIWFTTNCSLKELEQVLTPRTSSRLVYQADVLEVTRPGLAAALPVGAFDSPLRGRYLEREGGD